MEKLICGKVIRNFPYDYVFLMSHGRSLHGRRSSRPEVFLGKVVLKICSKFTGEHPCRSAISIKLLATLLKSQFGMGVLL